MSSNQIILGQAEGRPQRANGGLLGVQEIGNAVAVQTEHRHFVVCDSGQGRHHGFMALRGNGKEAFAESRSGRGIQMVDQLSGLDVGVIEEEFCAHPAGQGVADFLFMGREHFPHDARVHHEGGNGREDLSPFLNIRQAERVASAVDFLQPVRKDPRHIDLGAAKGEEVLRAATMHEMVFGVQHDDPISGRCGDGFKFQELLCDPAIYPRKRDVLGDLIGDDECGIERMTEFIAGEAFDVVPDKCRFGAIDMHDNALKFGVVEKPVNGFELDFGKGQIAIEGDAVKFDFHYSSPLNWNGNCSGAAKVPYQ
jgi:hypothetical protein